MYIKVNWAIFDFWCWILNVIPFKYDHNMSMFWYGLERIFVHTKKPTNYYVLFVNCHYVNKCILILLCLRQQSNKSSATECITFLCPGYMNRVIGTLALWLISRTKIRNKVIRRRRFPRRRKRRVVAADSDSDDIEPSKRYNLRSKKQRT